MEKKKTFREKWDSFTSIVGGLFVAAFFLIIISVSFYPRGHEPENLLEEVSYVVVEAINDVVHSESASAEE